MRTQLRNRKGAVGKGIAPHAGMIAILQQYIESLTMTMKEIERQLRQKLQEHAPLERAKELLDSIPGVDLLLAVNILIVTTGENRPMNPRSLANYLGICPQERSSGTSLRKRPRSSRLGPPRIRKLLQLAARSVVQHDQRFKRYYQDKVLKEGKPKMLVLNNVENQLLRTMCGVLRNDTPYRSNYHSVRPA